MFDNCFEWLSFARQLALYIDSGLEHGNFFKNNKLRCGGTINEDFVANLVMNLSVKEF